VALEGPTADGEQMVEAVRRVVPADALRDWEGADRERIVALTERFHADLSKYALGELA
jgi:hypothetical protein